MKRMVMLLLVMVVLAACGSDAHNQPAEEHGGHGHVHNNHFEINLDELLEEDSLWWTRSQRLYATSPAVGPDGRIFFGGWDGKLYALAPDGEELWSVQTDAKIDTTPTVSDAGTVLVGSWDGKLYALEADGREAWTLNTDGVFDVSVSVDADERVYAASDAGTFYRLLADGSVDWQIELPAAPTTAASIYDGASGLQVFVGTADAALHCIQDGQIAATANLSAYPIDDVAVDADGNAYVGATNGHLIKVDPNCEVVWDENLTYASLTSPTLDDEGFAYVGGLNEQIYRIATEDGALAWAEATGRHAPLLEPPTIGAGERMYGGANSLLSITRAGTIELISSLDILPSPLLAPAGGVYATTERGHLVRLDVELDELGDSDWPIQYGNPQRTGYLAP